MSFGKDFQYVPAVDILDDGQYLVQLGIPQEIQVGRYAVLRFPFTVVGKKEKHAPNYFDLFDVDDPDDPKKIEMFNKRASRIKDCFDLPGGFDPMSYMLWAGQTGTIVIKTSPAGFKNVEKFLPKAKQELPPDSKF